jgi:hypothetical protein
VGVFELLTPVNGDPSLRITILPVTPRMEGGIADHVWSLEELVGLLARQQLLVA